MVESFITFHSLQNYWIWLVPSPQRGTTFFEAHAKSATMLDGLPRWLFFMGQNGLNGGFFRPRKVVNGGATMNFFEVLFFVTPLAAAV